MSAPQGNIDSGSLNAARLRLALAQEARANATREQIEARGIRPDVHQIIHHMNRAPSHSFKRARLNDSMARRIYDDEDDEAGEEEHSDEKTQEEEAEFEAQWQGILAEEGLQDVNMFLLAEFRQIARQRIHMLKKANADWQAMCRPPKKDRFDLLGSLCTCTEIIVEVCKHLRPLDIVHLYSISKNFHRTISKHMRSSIFAWANHMAPTATRIYSSPVYHRWFIPDPASRLVTPSDQELSKPQPGQARLAGQEPLNEEKGKVRRIPGLLWLQMVVAREIRVRDIIACLARRGHRLPEGAHITLKKIWLVMDASSTHARMILLNNPDFFSNEDLYIAQLFMVKLVLAFNDPIFGPQSSHLMRLMMGQRGLTPLWEMLRGKRYRTVEEIRHLKLRYDVGPEQFRDENEAAQHGVPIDQLGVIHFEGWGTGLDHLCRPDQLIPLEAARRQLDLDSCIDEMMIYGHVDFETGNSLVPSLDEMYMSDDELPPACKDWKPLKRELIHSGCGNVPFEPGMWQPKHVRKARWKTLTEEEKAMILEEEQEEMDDVKQLNAARLRFDIAWADVAKLTSIAMSKKRLNAKFKVLPPSPADMEDHLHQFARPQRLRLASNYTNPEPDSDAMDIDVDSSSTPTPSHNLTLPLRPAQRRQQPPSPDPDDPSTIPDEDLELDPIPPAELRGIYKFYRPRHRPQSESDTEDEDEPEEEYSYRYTNTHPQPQPQTQPQTYPHLQAYPPDLPTNPNWNQPSNHTPFTTAASTHPYPNVNPVPNPVPVPDQNQVQAQDQNEETDDASTEYDDSSSETDNEQQHHILPLPNIPIYDVDPTLALDGYTPATSILSGNTDEMLLAQADLEYSDDDDDDQEYEDGDGDHEPGYDAEDEDHDDDIQRGGEGGEGEEMNEEGGGEDGGGEGEEGEMGERLGEGEGVMHGEGDGMAPSGVVQQYVDGNGNGLGDVMMLGEEATQEGDEDEMGVAGAGGVFGDVDWDHFLSNPGAYTVESEGVVALAPVVDGDETEEEGGDMEDVDEDEMEEDMDAEEGEEDEEEEVDINTLMGGLHVGQGQADNQQVFQQAAEAEEDDEIDLAEYVADEDVGEDERTKKLRDWFRPW
jgi:hypothetical protein